MSIPDLSQIPGFMSFALGKGATNKESNTNKLLDTLKNGGKGNNNDKKDKQKCDTYFCRKST